MNNFAYTRPDTVAAALAAHTANSHFLAGGTNLIDLMREGIAQPATIVDIARLPLDTIEELPGGGVRLGAFVRNSHLAAHPLIRQRYPVLSQAILMGASGQIRNMATTAGNLLQRTRCYYFYDDAARCNKRNPGAGCDAIGGFNRIHAILGATLEPASEACVATHPSDMCVALAALDATVNITGPNGDHTIPVETFHRLPGSTPRIDTNLEPGELITSVDVPPISFARHSLYRKVRDRASYAFAIVSVAAALKLEDGKVKDVAIALGGVAHKPWRARAAEQALAGMPATAESFAAAASRELARAIPLQYNAFKIELAKRTIAAVLTELAGS